jgi:hypothetical protein
MNGNERGLSSLRIIDWSFEHDVLEKLTGWRRRWTLRRATGSRAMTAVENRIVELERNDERLSSDL